MGEVLKYANVLAKSMKNQKVLVTVTSFGIVQAAVIMVNKLVAYHDSMACCDQLYVKFQFL